MAGIGVLLRQLSRQNNLLGLTWAYVISALASTGPWLFTVMALGGIMLLGSHVSSKGDMQEFRAIIIYNFAFSLVLSGPVCMVMSRYLADAIYAKRVEAVPSVMLLMLGVLYVTQLPLVIGFYAYVARMSVGITILAVINFLLISTVWLIMVCIHALKNYLVVMGAFMIGMLTAVATVYVLTPYYAVAGMLAGFSVGVAVVAALLAAKVFTEYPSLFTSPFHVFSTFRAYWETALYGLVYNAAIWVDKWLMWFAPEAEKTTAGMVMYPHYDSAMFLAYLTIIPSMAMFLFSVETAFFPHYLRFYRDIQEKATLQKIQRNHYQMLGSVFGSSGNFLVLQGSICLVAILVAPKLLAFLGNEYQQIGIFRYGVLGALFHALAIFLLMLLSYFDNRRAMLGIGVLFLLANGLFTWGSLQAGFSYYGYGYFLAALVTFMVTMLVTVRYVLQLPYHTFITTNKSVVS